MMADIELAPVLDNETTNLTIGERLLIKGDTMGKGQVEIMEVPLNKIKLARNSRLDVTTEEIAGLMQSIKETGLLQPIGVVKAKGGGYEIVYGNRRFLAVSKLGKTKIPAIIHTHKTDAEGDLKNLTENIQRRNISLVEAGRYMELLQKQNLSSAEIAVRLGVSSGYVKDCLAAFSEVPKKFRSDIEVRTTTSKIRTPGKVSISAARAIITAGKQANMGPKIVDKLFEMAKHEDKFEPTNVAKYAAAMKAGSQNPIDDVVHQKRVHMNFWIDDDYYQELYHKHVSNGHYKSLNGYFVDILKGKVAGRLKVRV